MAITGTLGTIRDIEAMVVTGVTEDMVEAHQGAMLGMAVDMLQVVTVLVPTMMDTMGMVDAIVTDVTVDQMVMDVTVDQMGMVMGMELDIVEDRIMDPRIT